MKTQHKKLVLKLSAGIIFMFCFCYLLVPFYNLVCKQAGINGRSSLQDPLVPGLTVDRSRTVTITFMTTVHAGLPFSFEPMTPRIDLHPGETREVYFLVENHAGYNMTVQAIPSVAPGLAAKYLKKTECFCFTQQTFVKNERAKMPVIFHLDPELPNDITYLTLNYTLFDAAHYLKNGPHFSQGRIDF